MTTPANLMPLSKAAKLLHCTVADLVRLRRRGKFPPIWRVTGRRYLVEPAAFEAWLDGQRVDEELADLVTKEFR